MKEEQNSNKIAKYLSDNIDSREREELFAWIKENPENKTLFEESMQVWETAEASELDFQPNTDTAWRKIDSRLQKARQADEVNEATIRPISSRRTWLRMAAAVVFLGLAWWFTQTGDNTGIIERQTIAQEKTTIDLPDGTKVWLNQNSTLRYKKLFDKRVVNLEGEAFFDVAKMNGKPFEIFAGNSKTKVLGTRFNVRAYPKEKRVELMVEEGKVEFSAESEPTENILLVANEYGIYTKETQEIEKAELAKINAAAWQKGALRFNNTRMEEVIESLERYYDIEIAVTNKAVYNCKWDNTVTYQQPNLDSIIYQIKYATSDVVDIQYQKNRLYKISGEGCK